MMLSVGWDVRIEVNLRIQSLDAVIDLLLTYVNYYVLIDFRFYNQFNMWIVWFFHASAEKSYYVLMVNYVISNW